MHAHANSRNCKSSRDVFEADSDDANVLLLMLVVSYSAPILSRFVAASASACCRAVSRSPRLHVPSNSLIFIHCQINSRLLMNWLNWQRQVSCFNAAWNGMSCFVSFIPVLSRIGLWNDRLGYYCILLAYNCRWKWPPVSAMSCFQRPGEATRLLPSTWAQ